MRTVEDLKNAAEEEEETGKTWEQRGTWVAGVDGRCRPDVRGTRKEWETGVRRDRRERKTKLEDATGAMAAKRGNRGGENSATREGKKHTNCANTKMQLTEKEDNASTEVREDL